MRLILLMHALGLGAIGLSFLSSASLRTPVPENHSSVPTTLDDSTGARLLVDRQDDVLRVRGLFINDSTATGPLTYELDVRRTGEAGTSQSTQSGQFETAPMQIDTLSTVRVNVQPGDRGEMHLSVRRDETVVDEVRRQRTF
jgi:hypothetical protein